MYIAQPGCCSFRRSWHSMDLELEVLLGAAAFARTLGVSMPTGLPEIWFRTLATRDLAHTIEFLSCPCRWRSRCVVIHHAIGFGSPRPG